MFQQDNDDVKAALRHAISLIDEFRKFDPKMEANQMLIYLLIAAKPGIKLKDIEARCDLGSSAVSRNVLALSSMTYPRRGEAPAPGHDLVASLTDPMDSRAKIASTTPRGRKLAERIGMLLRGACEAVG